MNVINIRRNRPKYLKAWQYLDCCSVANSSIDVHTIYTSNRVPSVNLCSLLDSYVLMLQMTVSSILVLCWTMRSLNHASRVILTHANVYQDYVFCRIVSSAARSTRSASTKVRHAVGFWHCAICIMQMNRLKKTSIQSLNREGLANRKFC